MKQAPIIRLVLLGFLVVSLSVSAFAQGRGRGGGGGRGSGNSGGPPAGSGAERGLGNSANKSEDRASSGRNNASEKSKGRSDDGLERARVASTRLREADKELREHPGVAHALRVNANDLRSGYQNALLSNPDLKFGQYVSATRLGQNLGARNPNITRDAILGGLASGRSLGQTLQDLGLSQHEASEARRRADREIREAKKKK